MLRNVTTLFSELIFVANKCQSQSSNVFYNSNLDGWFELYLGHAYVTVLFLCLCYVIHKKAL